MKPGTRITAEFLESVPIGLAFTRFLDQARENGNYDATIDRVMWAVFPNDRSVLVNMLRPFDVDGGSARGKNRCDAPGD